MKKLLLVLMVVAMASFLFVGCLPGGTTPDPTPDPDPDPTPVPVTIAVEDEYLATTGVVYVKGDSNATTGVKDVVVTFPEAVASEYIVKVAIKLETATTPFYVYVPLKDATPDVTRKIWTAKDVDFSSTASYSYGVESTFSFADCTSYCLVALEKHPCCPGEEVALKVITVDMTAPLADLKITFKDCADACTPDPCATGAAYFTFTSVTPATACLPAVDCCGDACSGLASWTVDVIPGGACAASCEVLTGVCPVEGTSGCTCLVFADGLNADGGALPDEQETYKVTYTLLDNVGNKFTEDWTIVVDTDSVVSFTGGDATVTPVVFGTAITVHDVATANCP